MKSPRPSTSAAAITVLERGDMSRAARDCRRGWPRAFAEGASCVFYAVGLWYAEFSQTTDDELRELLARGAESGRAA